MKDSGIEWLGKVPAQWDLKRLKHIASIEGGQSPKGDDVGLLADDFDAPPFLQGNAEFSNYNPVPRLFCYVAKRKCIEGDILLSVRAPVGALNVADQQYGIGRGLVAIRCKHADFQMLWYVLQHSVDWLKSVSTGSTYDAVTVQDVANIPIAHPPLPEQRAIADFLDVETERIDSLIANQRRLLDLLCERRQAIITHAVTKGLDDGVAMKNGWQYVPIRRLFRIVNGGTPTSDARNWDGDVAWATPIDLAQTNGKRIESTMRTLSRQGLLSGSRSVPAGSLILSTRAPIGYVSETMTDMAFNQGCRGLVPVIDLDVRYFRYQLIASTQHLDALGNGSTFTELSGDSLASFKVFAPPLPEQRAIADYLDAETQRIDTLVSKLQSQIELLTERRQAVITAAVTGKLEIAT